MNNASVNEQSVIKTMFFRQSNSIMVAANVHTWHVDHSVWNVEDETHDKI